MFSKTAMFMHFFYNATHVCSIIDLCQLRSNVDKVCYGIGVTRISWFTCV